MPHSHAIGSPEWRNDRLNRAMAYGRHRVARLDLTPEQKTAYLDAIAEALPEVIAATAAELTAAKENPVPPERPTVGRIVHYVSHGTPPRHDGTQAHASACRAAIVTADDGRAGISLAVLNPEGAFFNRSVKHSDNHEGGTWHWPERSEWMEYAT